MGRALLRDRRRPGRRGERLPRTRRLSGLAWGVGSAWPGGCRLEGEGGEGKPSRRRRKRRGNCTAFPSRPPPTRCCSCSAAATAARGGRGAGDSFPLLQGRKDRARPLLLLLLRARDGGGRDLTRERAERSRPAGPVMRLPRRAQSRTRPKGLPAGRGEREKPSPPARGGRSCSKGSTTEAGRLSSAGGGQGGRLPVWGEAGPASPCPRSENNSQVGQYQLGWAGPDHAVRGEGRRRAWGIPIPWGDPR